jgi:hypothetical protein
MRGPFAFFTNRAEAVRKHLSHHAPFLPFLRPPEEFGICVPTSASSKLFLGLGGAAESFIDIVGFLDIFIWFFTGELDTQGLLVPKPFFYRCILPGTLVQVLDHPTLPNVLPSLISQAMDAASAAGWSRVIRWVLAVIPAFVMVVVNPLSWWFFRQIGTDKGIMRYAESYGVLAPVKSHSVLSRPSQVGMLFHESLSTNIPSPRPISGRNLVAEGLAADLPPDLPSPRPSVWGHRTIQETPSFLNLEDSAYNFDFTTMQY